MLLLPPAGTGAAGFALLDWLVFHFVSNLIIFFP